MPAAVAEKESTVAEVFADIGVTPDEMAAAIALVKRQRAEEAERAEARARQKATGYPKPLYNPIYPGESILIPGTLHRLRFRKGKIEVRDAEQEALVRSVCKGRVYEMDLATEKVCPRCHSFVSGSAEALQLHIERTHLA